MRRALIATVLGAAGLLAAVPAAAQHEPSWGSPGSLVGVSVEVEGTAVPLYPAPDGSGRLYLEAREGARYAVELANRTDERLGVVLTVDGLNVISGELQGPPSRDGARAPGRMYVLYPWGSVSVKGWRTSLDDIRRFTFVDERASYAARSGKANARMGWIEVAVYRERPRPHTLRTDPYEDGRDRNEGAEGAADAQRSAPRAEAPAMKSPPSAAGESGSYPGTGWGAREGDRAMLVDFQPQASPADRLTLRYEYAPALRALGIFPAPWWARDRLRERESGEAGFARPPRW
jgi:hypothetical protein